MKPAKGRADFVIDCSVVMSWCFADEANDYSDRVLQRLKTLRAVAPPIWPLEIANVLASAERRARLIPADSARFLKILRALPISIAEPGQLADPVSILPIARDYGLSSYDASYLSLAISEGLSIATLDKKLSDAAKKAGPGVFEP